MAVSVTANLLGAAALAINDRVQAAATAGARAGASAPAALLHLARTPGRTQEQLRHALGLSQPGTANLVDRLAAAGLLVRAPGADGRSHALLLTEDGTAAAQRVLARRAEALQSIVDALSPEHRRALDAVLPYLLATLPTDPGDVSRFCRLCDVTACESDGSCPVTQAREEGRPHPP